jgi:hypothetical protein
MLRWWRSESDPIAKGQLSGLITHFFRESDTQKVWAIVSGERSFYGKARLYSRLARSSTVGDEVRRRILIDLNAGDYQVADLNEYARLPYFGIREWFIRQQLSPDKRIRKLAERVAGKSERIPDWLVRSSTGPDRRDEVYSCHGDLKDVDKYLQAIGKKLSIVMPKLGKTKQFLAFAGTDCWFVGALSTQDSIIHVWLRAEDTDAIELVVTFKARSDNRGL